MIQIPECYPFSTDVEFSPDAHRQQFPFLAQDVNPGVGYRTSNHYPLLWSTAYLIEDRTDSSFGWPIDIAQLDLRQLLKQLLDQFRFQHFSAADHSSQILALTE